MMYLWDSNILRHFTQSHTKLNARIERVEWQQVALPSVVMAEVLKGRADFALKAPPSQAELAHRQLMSTLQLFQRFTVVVFDDECANMLDDLQKRLRTRKRYADVMIASMAIAKNMIVVTRNQKHFSDLLPANQLENWID